MKVIMSEKYMIMFDDKTGAEVLTGIGGNPDPFVLDYPSMIDVGIMGHCINNCNICYQGDADEPHMTLENFKLIVDQSKNYVNQMALGGRGDPNLHPEFIEIIKYARQNGIVPNYTTSGINLTDEHVQATKDYCGAVAVSDYRFPHTYKAIKMFQDAEVKTNMHFVFTAETYLDATEMLQGVDVWRGRIDLQRLNAVIFLLFKPQGRGKGMNHLIPSDSMLRVFAEHVKKPSTKFKIGMDSCLINKISSVRELTKSEVLFADTCEGARMSCYITPDLKFMPCSFGSKGIGEKIKETSIKQIWDKGVAFDTFRNCLKKKPNVCPFELEGWV